MKKLLCVVGCLVLLSSSPVLAVEDPSVVTVHLSTHFARLFVVTSTGNVTAQKQEFKAEKNDDASEMLAFQYQKLVTQYTQQGYVLQGVVPGRQNENGSSSTLIFVKAAKL